jgi:hypothetical protein
MQDGKVFGAVSAWRHELLIAVDGGFDSRNHFKLRTESREQHETVGAEGVGELPNWPVVYLENRAVVTVDGTAGLSAHAHAYLGRQWRPSLG